jgi:hypothetical protein
MSYSRHGYGVSVCFASLDIITLNEKLNSMPVSIENVDT